MCSQKQVICPERLRRVPPHFSWVDQRLVRDGYLKRLDVHAAALYLFLITVANGDGLSWYGDGSIARRLSIDEVRLRQARGDLVRAGLLAYANGVVQVLALGHPLPAPPASPPQAVAGGVAVAVAVQVPMPALTAPAQARPQIAVHLAALHAALRKPS